MIQSHVGHRRLLFIINTLSSPSASVFVWSFLILMFFLSSLVLWLVSCNDGKRSFLVWYALFCFLLFLFYVLLSFLLFSSVCFSDYI